MENTLTRSTGRFCLNQDNNKTKGGAKWGIVKPRSDNDTVSIGSSRRKKKWEECLLTNPLGEWLRAHAEVMKIRWKTHTAHASTALLTYYRSCPKGYFHFLSFIWRNEIFFSFLQLDEGRKRRRPFWLDLLLSLSLQCRPFYCGSSEIQQIFIFIFIFCLFILGSFRTSFLLRVYT